MKTLKIDSKELDLYIKSSINFKNMSKNEAVFPRAEEFMKEFNLSIPNRKYLQKAHLLIEDMWTDIKKGKLNSESPIVPISPTKRPVAILRPIYNHNNELLLEIEDGRKIERLFLDREKFKYFRYEKSVTTDYGSATLKYVDSRTAQDETTANHVNETLDTYFRELFPPVPRHKYWDKYFTRDEI